jgi:hypothetical protein
VDFFNGAMIALYAGLVVAAIVIVVRSNRKAGLGLLDWKRKYMREVRVECGWEEAHALVHRGLSAVLRTRTSESRKRGEFGAWAMLPNDSRAERQRLQFVLERTGIYSTRVVIISKGVANASLGSMHANTTLARRDQVDRLADWLASADPAVELAEESVERAS